jgi:serine acetyltransferase
MKTLCRFLNRLSDLLFQMARKVDQTENRTERLGKKTAVGADCNILRNMIGIAHRLSVGALTMVYSPQTMVQGGRNEKKIDNTDFCDVLSHGGLGHAGI